MNVYFLKNAYKIEFLSEKENKKTKKHYFLLIFLFLTHFVVFF
jgi:hypothetical protein